MMSRNVRHSECQGLPELTTGCHFAPEDGACLMEYVSVLAGAPFSDHPRCTDPTLAALARLVNDACTDSGRPLLTAFAPELAGTGPVGPRGTAAIVLATASCAHEAAGEPAAMRSPLRRAQRRYDKVTGAGALASLARHLDPVHRRGPASWCLQASVAVMRALPDAQRDAALHGALAAAIAAAVDSSSRSPHDRSHERPSRGPTRASGSTAAGGAPNIFPT
jgi:hypothetical protein